jgi:protoporphyrinogen IX oxidase
MQLLVVGKIVHVIGNVLWLGGGALAAFALARLAREQADARLAAARALRAAVLMLVTPGMLLSLGAGLVMLLSYWSDLYAKAPWMHAKLTVGLIAAAFSGVLTGRLRRAAQGAEFTEGGVRLAGLVLVLSAIAGVSFVFVRFGQH